MNPENTFQVGAQNFNVAKLMEEIQAEVTRKTAAGIYRDARIAIAEKSNLINIKDEESFMQFYLDCLRNAVFVDINDFEIRERRRCARAWVLLKKAIWSMLKFYTYRLWSQQNQVNGLLLMAIEGLDEKYRARIRELETRLSELQSQQNRETSCPPPPNT